MAGISLRDAEAARLQITREQAAEVQGLYRSVYREYRKQLKSLTSGGATSSLRKAQLKKLTEELKTAYEGLGQQLEGNITSAVTQASQAVVQANNSWMENVGLKITGAYAHVPQDIVTLLASGKLYSDGWTLSKAIWGESQQKAHEIDLIVAKGVAANKSAFEIAKDLEKYVNPGAIKPWDWSKVYPGTSKKVDYNAQRLARTMVSHAYQQSLERVCNKNPFVIGYKWRSAHTARTCEICNQRSTEDHHGLGPGVYPKGELPLDHPNGMCTFLTVMSDDLMGISNRLADWANGKEDPALDQWYDSMSGVKTNDHSKNSQPNKGIPPKSEWVDIAKKQDWESIKAKGKSELSKLTTDEKQGLTEYTGLAYTRMNNYLRYISQGYSEDEAIKLSKIGKGQLKKLLKAQEGLSKVVTTDPMVLRRASDLGDLAGFLPGSFDSNKKLLEGKSISELNDIFSGSLGTYSSFLSTTPNYESGFFNNVEYVIYAPPGTNGAVVASISRHPNEDEFLVNAGVRVRVLSVEEAKDRHLGSDIRVFMEVIPE